MGTHEDWRGPVSVTVSNSNGGGTLLSPCVKEIKSTPGGGASWGEIQVRWHSRGLAAHTLEVSQQVNNNVHELQKHPQRPFPNPLSINNYMAAAVRLPCKSHTKMSLVAHPSWKRRREGIVGDVVQPPIPHTTKPPAVNGFLVTLAQTHISLNYNFQMKTIKTSSFYLTCTIIPYITKTTLTIFPREATGDVHSSLS